MQGLHTNERSSLLAGCTVMLTLLLPRLSCRISGIYIYFQIYYHLALQSPVKQKIVLKCGMDFVLLFPMVTNPRRGESKTYRKQMNKIRRGQLKVSAKIPWLCSRTCRLEAILRKLLIEEEPNLEQLLFRM